MPISLRRIAQDIDTIAGFSESAPGVGYNRPTFSRAWRKARDYFITQAQAAGCKTRIDAAGNVHMRPKSIDWPAAGWLSGSHIDSVPTGGKFDGVAGIVAPLEVLRSAFEAQQPLPLELIVFAESEGSTFGIGMIGSRLWTKAQSVDSVKPFLNKDGKNYFDAGSAYGVTPEGLAGDCFNPSHYRGFIEVHIEQGPRMAEAHVPLAAVSVIAGRKQYKVELKGVSNHSGSTPMKSRSDALVSAAGMIKDIHAMAPAISDQTVATVGWIECEPNAVNVIPNCVRFSVDLQSADPNDLARGHQHLQDLIRDSDALEANIIRIEDQPVTRMNADLVNLLRKCGTDLLPATVSLGLHDAAILSPHLPAAMLFIASKDGISHNPAETSRLEDIAEAARVLEKLVSKS